MYRTRLARISSLLFVGLAFVAAPAVAEEEGWPREIDMPRATVIVYQPQVESLQNDDLAARAAVAVTLKEEEAVPVFGAVWMTSRLETDRDTRVATIASVKIHQVRFPDADPENEQRLIDLLEKEIPTWDMDISLDRLLTSLDDVAGDDQQAAGLSMEPPKILFMKEPAVLVLIDGPPRLQQVEDSTQLMTVVNTPFLIAFDTKKKLYYLDGGEVWYTADEIEGPWNPVDSVPKEIVALRSPPPPDAEPLPDEEEEEDDGDDRIPGIVVAIEPSELIVADGNPTFTPISGTDLLYMSNTESDVLLEVDSQRYFVILSGRWFASKSLDGPWTYVAAEDLPETFAQIPVDSEMGHLLTWVAGTEESREAVLDNMIPQTAAVKRAEATLDVTYDGTPDFEPIEGTALFYAVNTNVPVIRQQTSYYACDEAVWFVAVSPMGPWSVADSVPQEIYDIPPSSPVYNVRYVYVYDSTPEIVYVGYTPGYTGSYVYHTTIVYGTGFYYPAWYGRYYYPRPATWGFHVRWNPWYGWGFGLSYSTGRFTVRIGFGGHRGWWGPVGWRGYRRGYHRGWHRGYRAGARAGYRAGHRSAQRQNLYRSQGNKNRVANTGGGNRNRPTTTQGRPNNVYTDKSGNVYRRENNGSWEKREGNDWKKTDTPSAGTSDRQSRDRQGDGQRPSTGSGDRPSAGTADRSKPSTGGSSQPKYSAPSTGQSRGSSGSNLNRDYNSRQRGSQRTNNYRSSGGSRGGSRGGGGRRR